MISVPPAPSKTPGPTKTNPVVGPDKFMDHFIKNWETTLVTSATQVINPLEESDQYFSQPCVDQSVCHYLFAILICSQHQASDPVMHLITCNYVAIPGSSCLVEWAFLLSAQMDSAHCGNMEKKKFGGLQRLWGAYADGRMEAHKEVWVALELDFDHLSEVNY